MELTKISIFVIWELDEGCYRFYSCFVPHYVMLIRWVTAEINKFENIRIRRDLETIYRIFVSKLDPIRPIKCSPGFIKISPEFSAVGVVFRGITISEGITLKYYANISSFDIFKRCFVFDIFLIKFVSSSVLRPLPLHFRK